MKNPITLSRVKPCIDLEKFFEDIPAITWEINHEGTLYEVESHEVIEAIRNAPKIEKFSISISLASWDIRGLPIVDFVRNLAYWLVVTKSKKG